MSDLIDRQAAIDAVMNTEPVFDGGGKTYQATADVISALTGLPSTHPLDPCETCLHKGKGWDEDPCDGCTRAESKYEPMVSPDGTLTVTVPKGAKVKRVLVEEEGTTWGFLLYPEQPAPNGKWERPLRKKTYERICSECGAKSWYCGTGDYVYCPWCGSYNGG